MIIRTNDPRPLVEETPRIDMRAMRDRLRPSPGVVRSLQVGTVIFGGRLHLEPNGEEAGAIVAIFPGGAFELARFVAEPGRLGGTMIRAECPRCLARGVRYLYARGRALACRACHGLAWASQRQTKMLRSWTSRRRIASTLGIEENDDGPEGGACVFPSDKPTGMHWARFGRAWSAYERAERNTLDAFEASLASRRYRFYVPGGYTHGTPITRTVPDPVATR